MCATGAVASNVCPVCVSDGLSTTSTTGTRPWDLEMDTAYIRGNMLIFWESCTDTHSNNHYTYYNCDSSSHGKCVYGRATVQNSGNYPAQINAANDKKLICCDAPAGGTAKWKQIRHTQNWSNKSTDGCKQVLNNCDQNSNQPAYKAGDYWSEASCLDMSGSEENTSETYTRPANCPESANTCLKNVHTNATLFVNANGATAAWASNAPISAPEKRVMYWQNCGTTCFEAYGCQTDQNSTQLNHGKYIYAPLYHDQNTGPANGEGAYAYKIIGSSDPDRYELLYCDASQNKWIKLTKADATDDTTNYIPITVGSKTLYVSSPDNISATTLWSTAKAAPTQNGEEEEEAIPQQCQSDRRKIQAITTAMNTLKAFKYTDDTCVWTTAEGKFNTARLGSDIASGIAMGLTGGLVSNVIIKNKQIKQGIQGYQCTVDSNIIADYGDEFVIDLAY